MITRRTFMSLAASAVLPYATARAQTSALTVEIQWLGGPTVLIKVAGFSILTDPMLGQTFTMGDPNDPVDPNTERQHKRAKAPDVDLKAIDLILLSHGHPDHFDMTSAKLLPPETPMLLPPADREKIAALGMRNLDMMDWGASRQFKSGAARVTIDAVTARHSEDADTAAKLGRGNGYWLEIVQGDWRRTLYLTGDTMPTPDVIASVEERGHPDLLIPNMGGVGVGGQLGKISMAAEDAAKMARALKPRMVLPVHHSTFDIYQEPIARLPPLLEGSKVDLKILKEGGTMMLD